MRSSASAEAGNEFVVLLNIEPEILFPLIFQSCRDASRLIGRITRPFTNVSTGSAYFGDFGPGEAPARHCELILKLSQGRTLGVQLSSWLLKDILMF